ncbi:MAG TPA: hypothetical protein VII76_13660 [Acidimicrobiales bacterium]
MPTIDVAYGSSSMSPAGGMHRRTLIDDGNGNVVRREDTYQ